MENSEQELFDAGFIGNWHRHYQKVEAFLKQKGNGQVPEKALMDTGLVKWIEIQHKIKNKLPSRLKSKLAVPDLDLYEKSTLWERRYYQLAGFVKEHGHCCLPADDAGFEALKDWLQRQIQNKRYLSECRFMKLDLLGVDWQAALTPDQRWDQMYLKLKEFRGTSGHCLVPQNWEQDKPLSNWVRVQRRNQAMNKLCPERERRLNELDFTWHIQNLYDSRWQHFYQELKVFYQAHGHCRVPGKYSQLTSWIENQRTAKKKNLLAAGRERKLNDIDFTWQLPYTCW